MAARGDRNSNDEAAVLRSDVGELAGRVSDVVPRGSDLLPHVSDVLPRVSDVVPKAAFALSMPPSVMPPSSDTPLSLAPELLEQVNRCFAELAGPESGIDAV